MVQNTEKKQFINLKMYWQYLWLQYRKGVGGTSLLQGPERRPPAQHCHIVVVKVRRFVAIAGPGWLLIHAGRGLSNGINGGTRILGTS